MNILFLPSWYESEEEPASGSFFTEQAIALKDMGNSVTLAIVDIINFPYKTKRKMYEIIHETRHGLDVYRIKVPSFMTGQIPAAFFKYYSHYYFKLYRYLTDVLGLSFNVIYAHSFWHAGYIATLLKKRFDIPVIVQEHRSMLITGEFKDNVNPYLKRTVLDSDAFYCVSNALRNNIVKRVGLENEVTVLPNMVDARFRYQSLPQSNRFVFSFIGSIAEGKQIRQLIRCFRKFLEHHDNAHLYIAGDGPLKQEICKKIESDPVLEKHTNYLGRISRDAVCALLGKTNAFILPSRYETFGVVYIEALAVGRPVIGTKNGGANDIIDKSNGLLVDVNNDEQLCEAMETVYSQFDSYDLEKISSNCLKAYSEHAVMKAVSEKMAAIIK